MDTTDLRLDEGFVAAIERRLPEVVSALDSAGLTWRNRAWAELSFELASGPHIDSFRPLAEALEELMAEATATEDRLAPVVDGALYMAEAIDLLVPAPEPVGPSALERLAEAAERIADHLDESRQQTGGVELDTTDRE
ncbi:MAG TPA: hypothetical protein QGH10_12545 [Armatimonadota bacterium]|jgi:hypothetical protein|nr:hypothetical protein [Armatimonadota bacterium]